MEIAIVIGVVLVVVFLFIISTKETEGATATGAKRIQAGAHKVTTSEDHDHPGTGSFR